MLATDKILVLAGLIPAGTRGEESSFLVNDSEKIHYQPTHAPNTVFGKLTNLAVYRQMVEVAGYAAVTDAKEFTFHLPVGFTGNVEQNLKGGYGAKHILINRQHIERIHTYYKNKLKTAHPCASLIACLDEFLALINQLDQPEYADKVALAWEERGKFVLATRMPFKTSHDNYLLCVFVPDTDYRFSIITIYPISQHTFTKIKYGDARFSPVCAEVVRPTEPCQPTESKMPANNVEPIAATIEVSVPKAKKIKKAKQKDEPNPEDTLTNTASIESLAEKGVIQESTCLKFIKRTKLEYRRKLNALRGKRIQGLLKECEGRLKNISILNDHEEFIKNNLALIEKELKNLCTKPPNFKDTRHLEKYIMNIIASYIEDLAFIDAFENEYNRFTSVAEEIHELNRFIDTQNKLERGIINEEITKLLNEMQN